ncbi:MAG: NUMOD3 domain-containing DNA-binding protein [Nanoarchaeota archaeon]
MPTGVYKKTEEHKIKLSKAQIGKKLSEETKKKISDALKGERSYWFAKSSPTKGKRLTEKHRKKISIALKKSKCPSKERDMKISKMYQNGATGTEIAKRMNCSMGAVYCCLKRNKTHVRHLGAAFKSDVKTEGLISLYQSGFTVTAISKMVNLTDGSISRRLNKAGIKIRTAKESFDIAYREGRRIPAKGANHPSWKGGLSFEPYSPLFNRQLKEKIRVRDNFICQLCGVPELECNRRLSIHHIDYNKQNCDTGNLTSLCVSCNAKVNKERKYWKDYFKCQERKEWDWKNKKGDGNK